MNAQYSQDIRHIQLKLVWGCSLVKVLWQKKSWLAFRQESHRCPSWLILSAKNSLGCSLNPSTIASFTSSFGMNIWLLRAFFYGLKTWKLYRGRPRLYAWYPSISHHSMAFSWSLTLRTIWGLCHAAGKCCPQVYPDFSFLILILIF